jgi:hypothetical protein
VTNNSADDGSAAYLTTLSYTVGDGAGMLSGTTLYYGGVHGAGANDIDTHFVSVGLPVPVEGLSVDVAADWVDGASDADDEIYQIYAAYALSDKATLNARYEWGVSDTNSWTGLESVAVGVTYDLWDNVTSRVEYMSTSEDGSNDDDTLAINLVYSF